MSNNFTYYKSVCSVCGQYHNTNDCSFLQNVHHISDAPVVSHAKQTLPKNLEIVHMSDGSTTVITKVDLAKGTTFGPLYARKMSMTNPLTDFPIKVFGEAASDTYYMDFLNENYSNWMCFIAPAENDKEQNLICYQMKQDIFYTAIRTILTGEELRVWYAPYYAFKMKKPLYNKTFAIYNNAVFPETEQSASSEKQVTQCIKNATALLSKEIAEKLANTLPAQYLGALNDTGIWNCRFCLMTTKSVVSYAKHLMEHYKPLLGIFCNLCNKKCHNMKVLQRHKRTKHTECNEIADGNLAKENQHENSEVTCLLKMNDFDYKISNVKQSFEKYVSDRKIENNVLQSYSISNDKEHKLSIPLLHSNLLNAGVFLQNDKSTNENLELSNISNSINSDIATSEKFNFSDLVPELLDTTHDKAKNLDCDICSKKFDKIDYLYRHLRKHTGEFICSSCLVVFARKENLLSHTCLSKNLEYSYECSLCQKLFMQKKYLKRHMAKHNEIINCKWCHHVFSSTLEFTTHNCSAPHYVCEQCKKRFVHKAHLNRHIKLHNEPKIARKRSKKEKEGTTPVICEKCGNIFKNPYILKQHLYTHGERMFECDICHNRFHRLAVLREHKIIHQSVQIPCDICGKKLKSKKALNIHMLLHGNKKYQCDKCDKSFFQKCNYLKHYKHVHNDKVTYNCPHCSMLFTNKHSFDKHITHHTLPAQYSCSLCKKFFHKEYQLKRHVQTSHSDIIYRCPFCNMTARHRHSMRRHFERQHSTLKQDWDKTGFISELAEKSLHFKNEETNVQKEHNTSNKTYIDQCSNKFEDVYIREEEIDLNSGMAKETDVQNGEEKELYKQADITIEQIMTSAKSQKDDQPQTGKSDELTQIEVPQFNTNERNGTLSETVLRSAYIHDDNGEEIMFYVF